MSHPSLFSAVLELINTESETERQRVLERQRDVLLTDEAEQLLTQWLAQSEGDHARTLQERHELLVRCRKVGIQAAFAPPKAPPPSKAKIREALFALMDAASPTQRRRIIEQAQEVLLADATTDFLEAWIENEADFGEDDTLRALQGCKALLARCREIGIHAAFAQQPTETTTTSSPSQSIPSAFAADIQRAALASDRLRMDRSPQALNAAVQAWQTILARPDLEQYPEFGVIGRVEFAGTLLHRYQAFGQAADLEEAIKVYQQALKETPIGSPDRPSLLSNLGNALSDRFGLHGQVADLAEAIKVYQQTLKETPIGSADRPRRLNNLGAALSDRFNLHGQVTDLAEAIKLHQQALKEAPIGSPDRPGYLNNLGASLSDRFRLHGQVADLEEAIKLHQQALKDTPIGSSKRPGYLNNLGAALSDYFRLHGQVADLEEAIKLYQQALKETPIGSPECPRYLNNLGGALSERFKLHRQVVDLEEAIKLYQQALEGTPIGSPDRPGYLNNLGTALSERFKLHQQVVDLEEAIKVYQQALKKTPIGSPDRSGYLNNLATAFSERFKLHRQMADLQEAIKLYQQALKETLIDSSDRPRRLNNLGGTLLDRFSLRGQVADLQGAIKVYQQALKETPIGSPDRPGYLNNLATALWTRFRLHRQVVHLEEAIKLYQQALKETPIGSPDHPILLNNLGAAFSDRFRLHGQVADLEEAIKLYQQALKEAPIGSPDRSGYLNNLATALSDRFRLHGQVADLEEAIKVYQQALKKTPIDSPKHPQRLNNLGRALSDRFSLRRQVTDLEEAIKVYQQALNETPINPPDRPTLLNNLGYALSNRFRLHGQVADLEEAIKVYREGLSLLASGVNPVERRRLASNLGDLYYEQTQELSRAYEAYVQAAEAAEMIRQGVRSEEARQKQVRENALIYARLVHCCLELGKEEEAFHYATAAKGRAFVDLLSSVPLDLSKAQDDELQKKVSRAGKIRAQLDHILAQLTGEVRGSSPLNPEGALTLRDLLTEKRKNLLQEEETLWQQIRNDHPDYFATQAADPLTLSEALQLAAHLEATLLSYYRHYKGWVAFVVRDDTQTPLQVVELKVTDETLLGEWEKFNHNLSSCPQNKTTRLSALYKALIKPLHSVLPESADSPTSGETEGVQRKRLVVAPSFILHLVPFAALRRRRKRQPALYLNEEYDLTITPSLAVLNRIIKRNPQPVREKLCAIAYPGKKGEKHYLPNVVPEAEAIAKHFSKPTTRLNADATRQAALDHAPHHQIHHYSCHGLFDAEQVQHSGLLLAGGQLLSLRDLFNELRMPKESALTVLSACDTALARSEGGDELAGLLQGFVYAGTPAIIASLWPVNDAATRYLFERFYCYYTNGIAATTALRTAQQEMRQRGYDHPYYWAAFQPVGATFQQEANAAFACSAALEEVIPTHQPRHVQGADEMSNNLTDERLIDDALDLITHFLSDVEELYDTLNDEQLDTFLATLNSWAAQTETISDEEALLTFANTLITHIEGTPHLCLFFRGHIDAQAHQDAREILRQDRKKRQAQTPVREKIKGYEEPKSVANTMNSGIKKAMALLKEEMEG